MSILQWIYQDLLLLEIFLSPLIITLYTIIDNIILTNSLEWSLGKKWSQILIVKQNQRNNVGFFYKAYSLISWIFFLSFIQDFLIKWLGMMITWQNGLYSRKNDVEFPPGVLVLVLGLKIYESGCNIILICGVSRGEALFCLEFLGVK